MAKSDIGIKIGIEGEKEFKASIKEINENYKTMKTEVDRVTSAFLGNEHSVEALTAKNDALGATAVQLEHKQAALKSMMQKVADAYGSDSTAAQKLTQEYNRNETALNKLNYKITQNEKEILSLTDATNENSEANAANSESVGESGTLLKAFGLDLDSVGKKLGLFSEQTKQLSGALAGGGISGGLALAAGAAAAAAAIKLVGDAVKEVADFMKDAVISATDYADEIGTLSMQSGFSTDFLQGIEMAQELVDVSADAIISSMRKLKKNLFSDSAEVKAAFDTLGIIPAELILRQDSIEDIFQLVIGGLSRVENELERDNIAMTLFGKGADELAGVIDDGGQKLYGLIDGLKESGAIMSGESLSSLQALDDTFVEFDNQMQAVKNQLAVEMAPALVELATQLLEVAQSVDWQAFGTAAAQVIRDTTPLIVDLARAVADAANSLSELMESISNFKSSGFGQSVINGVKTAAQTALMTMPGIGDAYSIYSYGKNAYDALRGSASSVSSSNSGGDVYLDGQKVGRVMYDSLRNESNRRGPSAYN